MATTDSRNFRCPDPAWTAAMDKAAKMRAAGYDVDVTKVLVGEVSRFGAETMQESAKRLGLAKSKEPVRAYRKPFPRSTK